MYKNLFLFSVLVLNVACSKNDSPLSPSKSFGSDENLEGLFVVDSFNIKLDTQKHEDNDSLFGSIAYKLNYHFENRPGTIQNLSVIIQDSIGILVCIDYAFPISINELHYLGDSIELIWFNLNIIDSLKFDIFISGVFWNYDYRTSTSYGSLGEFNWSEHKWFKIPK